MSVTFTIKSPRVERRAECHCITNGVAWDKCPRCKGRGFFEYTSAPDEYMLNMANETTRAVTQLIGLDFGDDIYGEISVDEMPSIRRRIIMAANSKTAIAQHTIEPYHLEGGHAGTVIEHDGNVATIQRMGAAFHHCGLSEDRILHQLFALERLIMLAQEIESPITFG